MKSIAILFIPAFFSLSCGTKTKDPLGLKLPLNQCVEELFFAEGSEDLGFVRMGDPFVEVAEERMGVPIISSDLEMVDSIPLCGNASAYAEAAYRFLDARVAEIDLVIYPGKENELEPLLILVSNSISAKNGKGVKDHGYEMWTILNDSQTKLIFLSDESVGYGRPAIRLLFSSGMGLAV